LRRFACFSQHTLQLWPCFVVDGDIVHRASRRLRWAPHNLVGARVHHPPCLHLWPSVITWRSRDSAEWWHIVRLCTTRLCGGRSLLYNSSSFIFLCQDKESLLQLILLPLNKKPKPCVRKG
jgi:hypothetical protein